MRRVKVYKVNAKQTQHQQQEQEQKINYPQEMRERCKAQ